MNYRGFAPFRGGAFYHNGQRFMGQGRISRIMPYRDGYRIWLGGWDYPFFVPYGLWNPFRFRLGFYIGFNAFYDPLGFYSLYDCPLYGSYNPYPYDGYPYDGYPAQVVPYYNNGNDNGYDDTELRGTVQSIDLHSGIVVVQQVGSSRTVSALLPPRDDRVNNIHTGDYVEFSGQWTNGQGGYDFDAAQMDRFDPRR